MILCLICALRAHVKGQPYLGEKDANIVAHNIRVHPDPRVAMIERRELEGYVEKHRVEHRESAR